ncbi:MAG: 3-phosphoserine/phosphohydroxythreonine transaminase [Gammaproteobacteria bacterium]|nr:3-phosphoserine/phosphohydroxythreonine transaminase [Gammaproteobacteria bacterium]
MSRIYNFSAGPAMLPTEVMQQVQTELLDWQGLGASVMEVSHRSKEFIALAEKVEQELRDLLGIPNNYKVLFLHGGAQAQFSMIPMHFLTESGYAAMAKTGLWSKIAVAEAERFGAVKTVVDVAVAGSKKIPDQSSWENYNDADYLYYCDNETVHGLEFNKVPDSKDVPLVCDMSSNILTRPIDINRFGLIFACAQKNMGPSGLCVVIIRDDLIEKSPVQTIPRIFNYKLQAEKQSMLNTPATFPWYVLGLVCEWVKKQGGIEKMHQLAQQRSSVLYELIDQSDFYNNSIVAENRSRINVAFNLKDESLNQQFLDAAKAQGLMGLKGHRAVGGMRASMYNSMPLDGAKKLHDFMIEFAEQVG